MRLTPSQAAIKLLCGNRLPPNPRLPYAERIQCGRDMLVNLTGVDYGFDLQKWHDHLRVSGEGNYTCTGRSSELPTVMKRALETKRWREAVRMLEGADDDVQC